MENAVLLSVGERLARPKTVCPVYYFLGYDCWFGQVSPPVFAVDDLIRLLYIFSFTRFGVFS